MRPNLITRLREEWNNLDPVDPLRGLIADAIDALAQRKIASKPLTDEQIDELARATFDVVQEMPDYQVNGDTWDREFARAIEAAHQIGVKK